jgi:hypothetical protein
MAMRCARIAIALRAHRDCIANNPRTENQPATHRPPLEWGFFGFG